ncbi:MAG: histidinol-phosphate transaminase, partial [Synechococcales cyanobacterium CRU_2_2]|nr:histidinol-phosphate transaminase [Synechococcales cyanobacterium CRU_2_2]
RSSAYPTSPNPTAAPAPAPITPAITPAQISIGNGSDEILRSLMLATCLNGAGSILVASPTFSMYAILAQALGIAVVDAGRNPETFEINLTAAQAAIDAPRPDQPPVRTVFVVHPNSPTANALTAAEIDWLRSLSDRILVVVDEAYFEFSGHTLAAEVLTRSNWVITRTFSKAFRLAAHRVGYSIASPEVTSVLENLRLPYNLPSLSQAAALVAMQNRAALLALVPQMLEERDRLATELCTLPQLKLYPSQANFFFAQLQAQNPNPQDPKTQAYLGQILQSMKQQGTMLRHTGNGLRISLGTPEENQRMLARLQQVLADHV